MEWESITEGKTFITDLGEQVIVEQGIENLRYAVWKPEQGIRRHQIVEVGNDLEQLQKKYDVPTELVMRVSA